MLEVAFLQNFKSARDACGIHEGAAVWHFKIYLTGPAEQAVNSRVALPKPVNKNHEGALRTYSKVFQFFF